jgi:hypothetical protein
MTPALAAALAAACVRIHAALRDLGDRPSTFQRIKRDEHIAAMWRINTEELRTVPGLASASEYAADDAPSATLHTCYASDSGILTEACVVVALCGSAFGSVSASIPVGPDVTATSVLMAWNTSIRLAWDDEVEAHRARLSALTALLVIPADPVTP